jgi:hypothetical protein
MRPEGSSSYFILYFSGNNLKREGGIGETSMTRSSSDLIDGQRKRMKEKNEEKDQQSTSLLNDVCPKCSHDLKYHRDYGCKGAYLDEIEGVDPEVFYGAKCRCNYHPFLNKE